MEYWAQDSKTKGLRIVEFMSEFNGGVDGLRWQKLVGDGDADGKWWYSREELIENGWERVE